MREMKFRAWAPDEKRMYLSPSPEEGLRQLSDWFDAHSTNRNEQDSSIMMWTGLKDKNRKEIYEGDIIRSTGEDTQEPEGHWTTYNEVAFKDGRFGWIGETTGELHSFEDVTSAVVAGNIYEHPNLLQP